MSMKPHEIRKLRQDLAWTQEQMARFLGLNSKADVCKLERRHVKNPATSQKGHSLEALLGDLRGRVDRGEKVDEPEAHREMTPKELTRLREEAQMTMDELARYLRLKNRASVFYMESGRIKIRGARLVLLEELRQRVEDRKRLAGR